MKWCWREVKAGVKSGCVDDMISTFFIVNNNCVLCTSTTNYYYKDIHTIIMAVWQHCHTHSSIFTRSQAPVIFIPLYFTTTSPWHATNTEPAHNMPLLSLGT